MRLRRLSLPIAGALGAALAVVPGLAAGSAPSSASFTAYDYGWMANGSVTSTKATIAQGGTVTFAYPSGISEHNADFGSGPKPSSCTQSAGPSSGSVPPLPHQATHAGWAGTCTFNSPGTYTFHCDVHTFMTGTIVVEGSGTTTGTTTTTGSPLTGASIPAHQRGTTVRGSVKLSDAARGGRLEVDLRNGKARAGRLTKTNLQPGTARFAVSLSPAAKRALRNRGRLKLTVQVTVRSPSGTRGSITRQVLLRR